MKNFKMLLTAGVLMAAVGGAFATNASKNAENSKFTQFTGYIFQSGHCVEKNARCQNVNTGILCTETATGGAQVFRMTATDVCTQQLWRLP